MQNIYSFKNAIIFTKKGISLLFLILLSITTYSNPIDKNSDGKRGYNFFTEKPWFTAWPNSKGEGSYSTADCSYTLSANREAATVAGAGTITNAGKTFTVTQLPPPITPDTYEPNNTIADITQVGTFTFTENTSTFSISSANCHISSDIDMYKIILDAGYSYTLSGVLYDTDNNTANNNYTLNVQSFWSTDGTTWLSWGDRELSNPTVPGGNLYIKIEPVYSGDTGTYGASIALKKAATTGCTYTLPVGHKELTWEAKTNQQAEVRTGSSTNLSCIWTATSNEDWITLTSGLSGTGNGTVVYSCPENTTLYTKAGTISIAGKIYTVYQTPRPLTRDNYEENNTVAQASLLPATFIDNVSTVSLSANCHNIDDVDYYKIELGAGYSYTIRGAFYNRNNQFNNSNYTLEATIYYSTNGSTWNEWGDGQLPNKTIPEGTLYLKVAPSYSIGNLGTYGVIINLKKAAATNCIYSLLPANNKVTSAEGNAQVNITTGPSCFRTATSNVSWITLTSGHSGTGSGTVAYSYTENATRSLRTGTLSIAGQTYTVTQLPPPLTPDDYEPNNTEGQAFLLTTPAFTANASTLSISPKNRNWFLFV